MKQEEATLNYSSPNDYDNSRISTYADCPMKYHNKYNLGLAEDNGQRGLNSRFSTHCIHDPITEWYFRGIDWDPGEDGWAERMAKCNITSEESLVKANAVYCIDSAKRCFNHHKQQFGSDFERFTILGAENYLVKNLESGIRFGSKPDVRVEDKLTGKLFTIEIKFSRWDFVLEAANINPQFLGQVNNTNGNGFIVTLIQPVGSKWQNFTAIRQEIEPTPEEMKAWHRDKVHQIQQIQRSYAEDVWPKNTPHACTNFGGCIFISLCAAGHPQGMLDRWPRKDEPLDYLQAGSLERGRDD